MVLMSENATALALAAAKNMPVSHVSVGWTPTTYIMLLILIVMLGHIGVWLKTRPDLKKIEVEGNTSLRRDLMEMMASMENRHALEVSQIRKAHEDEIHSLKRHIEARDERCEKENQSLREQVKALQGMIISWQIHSGQAMPLSIPPATQKMVDKIINAMNGTDEDRLSIIAAALEISRD